MFLSAAVGFKFRDGGYTSNRRQQNGPNEEINAPKNGEINPQAVCSNNRAVQIFQILTTLRLAWFAEG